MSTGSPKVIVTETAITVPGKPTPVGIPAGIIGTSAKGPAYVPVTVGTYNDFKEVFGPSDGTKYGVLGAYNYLNLDTNVNSVTYMRILGAGDGKTRNADGTVTHAGFIVGSGTLATSNPNAFAGGIQGRTHFIGCFMSESNGSTYFSDSGIQTGTNAVPIVRGVLMTASGVLATLSSSYVVNNTPTAIAITTGNLGGSTIGKLNSNSEFVVLLNGLSGSSATKVITASFDRQKSNYISTLNQDPTKINEFGYCLYSFFDVDSNLADVNSTGLSVTPGESFAFITTGSAAWDTHPANATSAPNFESFEDRFEAAKTPWVISQNYAGRSYNLFRFHHNSDGVPINNLKFTISSLTPADSSNKYSRFDLEIRDVKTNSLLETRLGLTLNPSDTNYIGKVIGDMRMYFDFDDSQKLVVDGDYQNVSKYVRVEIHSDVIDGIVPVDAVPVGFRGPQHLCLSGSAPLPVISGGLGLSNINVLRTSVEPPIPFRLNICDADPTNPKVRVSPDFAWGVQFEYPKSTTQLNGNVLNNGIFGYMKYYPMFNPNSNFAVDDNEGSADTTQFGVIDADRYNRNKFTLENIKVVTGSNGYADPTKWKNAVYVRAGGIAEDNINATRAWSVDDLTLSGNKTYSKFSFYSYGGFNGTNIFDSDKSNFTNYAVQDESSIDLSYPTVSAYVKALDIMKNQSEIDIQMLAIPGIRDQYVTNYALNVVSDRFDSFYIMDVEQINKTNTLLSKTESVSDISISNTIMNFEARSLDNSFGASYFPDINMTDPDTGSIVTVPASAAVLRAYAKNDQSQIWFAPAGDKRGVLDKGNPNVTIQLKEEQMDSLYNARINPIKQTVTDIGPTVYGQKTLQAANTSLNRVAVRRLLLTIRRRVKQVANRFIFEPNRESTLARFSSLVEPILANIRTLNGVSDYKVQIDTTTTTQQDIENNVIRGKIFIVPVNAVEIVSIDFEVS